jgi:hypothetical protein
LRSVSKTHPRPLVFGACLRKNARRPLLLK